MALTLVSNPSYTNGYKSRAIGGLSQAKYEFSRQDYAVDNFDDDGQNPGFLLLNLNASAGDITSLFSVGDLLYWEDGDGSDSNISSVKAARFSGGQTRVTVNESSSIIPITNNGFTNLLSRTDYRVQITILDRLGTTNLFDTIIFRYATAPDGRVFVDLSGILQGIERAGQDKLNFRIEWAEYFDGVAGTGTLDEEILLIIARKQQLDQSGANLWERLLTPEGQWLGFNKSAALANMDVNDFENTSGANSWAAAAPSQATCNFNTAVGLDSNYWGYTDNAVDDAILQNELYTIEYSLDIICTVFTAPGNIKVRFSSLANGEDFVTGTPSGGITDQEFQVTGTGTVATFTDRLFRVAAGQDSKTVMINFVNDGDGGNFSLTLQLKKFRAAAVEQAFRGNFLTRLRAPLFNNRRINNKVWIGWNKTSTVIRDPDIATRLSTETQLQQQLRELDINFNILNTTATNFVLSPTEPDLAKLPVTRDTLPGNAARKFLSEIITGDVNTSTPLTETQFYEIVEEADQCRNPLMVEWRNQLGALDQWLFSLEQVVVKSSDEGRVFRSPINEDFSTAVSSIGRQVDTKRENISVFAENLTWFELRALEEIKTSNEVYIYLTKDGNSKIQVRVTDQLSTEYRNRRSGYAISIVLEQPPNFSIYDTDLYLPLGELDH